jgi:hypothetical protein
MPTASQIPEFPRNAPLKQGETPRIVSMSLVPYAISGVTACIAAVAGVLVQVMVSEPDHPADTTDPQPVAKGEGEEFPPIPVPVYSQTQKIGYCVIRVKYDGARGSADEWGIALPKVTNELYVEFSSILKNTADGPSECAGRVGKRTDTFVIYQAEFYEKVD